MKKLLPTLFVTIGILLGALLFQQQLSQGAFMPVTVPAGGTGFSSTSIGTLIAGGTTATSTLRATSSPTVGYITATSTTATSTFANGINILGGCLRVGGSCLSTAVAPSIDWQKESNFGVLTLTASTSIPYWAKQSIYASSTLITSDRVGIATSTSARMLSVQGNALFSGDLTLANITASGTATTTNLRVTDMLTIGGDNITELVGTGLTLSGSTLTTSLGTSVDLASEVTGALPVANSGTGQISFTGGQLLYGNSTAALSSVATSSLTIGGGLIFSTTPGALVGGSNLTITARVSTSSIPTRGRVAYWTGNGTPSELGDVATTSVTCSSPLSCTAFDVLTGGGALTLNTVTVASGGIGSTTLSDGRLLVGAGTSAVGATSTVSARWGGTGFSLYSVGDVLYADSANSLTRLAISGTAGQVLMVSGGVPIWAATSSAASDVTSVSANGTSLTISPTTGAVLAEINLANANSWTGRQTFVNASSTNISSTQGAQFATGAGDPRVGVGTSTPEYRLDVEGGLRIYTGASSRMFFTGSALQITGGGQSTAEIFLTLGTGATDTAALGGRSWSMGITGTNNNNFRINSYNNAGDARLQLTIASTTNSVGISTSTPGATLSVHGNSLVSGTSTTAHLVATGTVALASSTVQIRQYPSFTVATSTAWTGTTTKYLGIAFIPERWAGVRCMTDVGTLNVVFGDATTSPNAMNLLNASTTVGDFKFTENNTFTVGEKRFVAIGTPASSPTVVSCTVDKVINP